MNTDKLTVDFEREVKGWSAHLVGTSFWGKGWTIREAFDRLEHELVVAAVDKKPAPRRRSA